jgi:CheY-like chemotaxis protein
MKVLVVDDVGYSRHYHCRLLQKFGFQAEAVETGLQALKALESDATIDVVLTDLMMREMDGIELFRRAQQSNPSADSGSAKLPAFILMTALRPGKDASQQKDIEKIRQAKELGFIDVLFKPIEPEVLKQTLENIHSDRGQTQIDTSGAIKQLAEIIDRLIAENRLDEAGRLQDELHAELDRLAQFASQALAG